jgi:ParB family transcriptional regulator, chromosome partitioning protein
MKRQNTALLNAFTDAAESQKVDELYQKIEGLQAELLRLQSSGSNAKDAAHYEELITQLTSQIASQQGTISVDLSKIKRNPNQPRKVFPTTVIQERAESLRREGQLTPIILLLLKDGEYMLEDGELRWRAAPLADLSSLEAVLKPIEEIDYNVLRRRALVNSNQREALHPLDQADALIEEICCMFPDFMDGQGNDAPSIAIPRILNTAIKRLFHDKEQRDKLNEMRLASEKEQMDWLESVAFKQLEERYIFQTLLGLQLNPTSVNSNIFSILKVTDEIREAIRAYGLEGSKALQLNRLSAETLKVSKRKAVDILNKAIAESINLSVRQTQAMVGQLIRESNPPQTKETTSDSLRAIQKLQNIEISSKTDRSDLEATRKILQAKLQEIEKLLAKK